DSVYASFSLGVDMSSYTSGHAIPLVASSQVIPLTTTDNLHWTWGLKYTNLNAIWWKINPDPFYPSWDANTPRGIAQYSELTFQYSLTIDPTAKTAKLTSSYTVGRVTDLWLLGQTPALHLNSTGTYYGNGTRINTQSVYSYLQQRQMKLSIVLAKKTILAGEKSTDLILTIDTTAKTAKLTSSYTVGRVTDLWLLRQTPALHLNSTGTYYGNGTRINTQSVYSYLQQRQMKLSIVLANKTILAGEKSTDDSETGQNVDNDTTADVSNTAIDTKAADGEPIFKSDFGVQANYMLYDASDSNPTSVPAVTRTVGRLGWGGNPAFAFQNVLTGFLPLFVAHVAPELYNQAKSGLVDFSVSNYLYIISYLQRNGYKIV